MEDLCLEEIVLRLMDQIQFLVQLHQLAVVADKTVLVMLTEVMVDQVVAVVFMVQVEQVIPLQLVQHKALVVEQEQQQVQELQEVVVVGEQLLLDQTLHQEQVELVELVLQLQ